MKPAPGVAIGPYQVIEQVGKGGMATVYKAYQPALERFVALKILPDFFADQPGFRERFHREAVAIARMRHPNILTVFDHGEVDGVTFIANEFVEGGTLADRLGRPMPVDDVRALLAPIAAALDYAHSRGIVHRDVKPSNILIAPDGTPILADFGLAVILGAELKLTQSGTIVGTPEYMAPEQCAGAPTGPATDVYALAVVAYQMLTGRVPFTAETPAAVILAQIQAPLPPPRSINPSLSPASEGALLRGLAKESKLRPATCTELVAALAGEGIPVTPASPGPRPKSRPATAAIGNPRVLAAIAAVAILALVGGGLAIMKPWASPAGSPPAAIPGAGHGARIYSAAMHGDDLSDVQAGGLNVRESNGAVEVAGTSPGGDASADFKAGQLSSFVAVLEMSMAPGTDFEVDWHLRGPAGNENAETALLIDLPNQQMKVIYSPYEGDSQDITGWARIPGLQAGAHATITIAVNGDAYAVYVGGKAVASGHDARVTGAMTPGFYASGTTGAWRIHSVAYYQPGG